MLTPEADGYGNLIDRHHRGLRAAEVIERDDGWFDVSGGAPAYFAPFEEWPAHQRRAIRLATGRVLDVGCGAGRVSLHLESRGLEVVGIDRSPLAVKVCGRRGVRDARVLPITQVGPGLGEFDTIVMFGNNFGLFGSFDRARRLLRRFHRLTSPQARILAESRDPYRTRDPDHKRYQKRNRSRGRMPGQLRMRVRSGHACTAWFDYLLVSPQEMRRIVAGTGWRVAKQIDSETPSYVGVLEKVEKAK